MIEKELRNVDEYSVCEEHGHRYRLVDDDEEYGSCLDCGEVSYDEWVSSDDVRETFAEDMTARWWYDADGTVYVADDSRGCVAVDLTPLSDPRSLRPEEEAR